MTEIKRAYETIFVLDATLGDEAIEALTAKFKSLIESNATIDSIDVWGKRRLAYEINDRTEGHYVLVNFTSNPEFPKELERVYGITDGVLRSIVIVKE
ncbi:MAG: 30S ribosomal protein S6 [Clostridia bacterium]|nr:30S ribosomal protein S6 [Clostridia bacterium]